MTAVGMIESFAERIGCEVKRDVPLSGWTTFKIGGPAELMVIPHSAVELSQTVKICAETGIRPLILGNGSNLLVSDSGVKGVIVYTGAMDDISLQDDETIRCAAGVSVSRLCGFALENGLSGLEFAYGIPGSVGGAIYMNAGAYGGEFSQVAAGCEYVDSNGVLDYMEAADMKLSYRHSVFNDNGGVVSCAHIRLHQGDACVIRERMSGFLDKRRDKQPLQYPSAGSVFKRPEGYFAGALIEQCGLKGKTVGGAQVSEKHAGFIINIGGATASDVLALIELIQKTVLERTSVLLETEIKILNGE